MLCRDLGYGGLQVCLDGLDQLLAVGEGGLRKLNEFQRIDFFPNGPLEPVWTRDAGPPFGAGARASSASTNREV
ncbi:MAG: hypothetical protein WBE26_05875 [Phycisphaerae bacterium]